MIGCSKKNRENYPKKCSLLKKKSGLKFYPGLPRIGLRTTGPWSIIHGHGYLSSLSPKSDKHKFSPNKRVFLCTLYLLIRDTLKRPNYKFSGSRLQLAGHCYRHPELSTQKLVLWEPTHGHRGRGRPNTTYIDTLKRDTGAFEASEIAALMADKRLWKDLVVARLRATK